jgi:hypothetical protein
MSAVILFLAGSFAGCSHMFGPEVMPTARVSGLVKLDATTPVVGRWVELQPLGGTVGKLASARLSNEGTFEIPDAPVGDVGIRLVGAPLSRTGRPALDRFLHQVGQQYLIRRTIPPGGSKIEINLLAEFDRLIESSKL